MRAAVIGAGKMGLPLACQMASRGHDVVAVDVDQRVVDTINSEMSRTAFDVGVRAFKNRRYEKARDAFLKSISHVEKTFFSPAAWASKMIWRLRAFMPCTLSIEDRVRASPSRS